MFFLFFIFFSLLTFFFMSLSSFVISFRLFLVFLFVSKILHFIPFRVYYILLKQKSKQNASKVSSKTQAKYQAKKQKWQICEIGMLYLVYQSTNALHHNLPIFSVNKVRFTTHQLAFLVSYMVSETDICSKQVLLYIPQIANQ